MIMNERLFSVVSMLAVLLVAASGCNEKQIRCVKGPSSKSLQMCDVGTQVFQTSGAFKCDQCRKPGSRDMDTMVSCAAVALYTNASKGAKPTSWLKGVVSPDATSKFKVSGRADYHVEVGRLSNVMVGHVKGLQKEVDRVFLPPRAMVAVSVNSCFRLLIQRKVDGGKTEELSMDGPTHVSVALPNKWDPSWTHDDTIVYIVEAIECNE